MSLSFVFEANTRHFHPPIISTHTLHTLHTRTVCTAKGRPAAQGRIASTSEQRASDMPGWSSLSQEGSSPTNIRQFGWWAGAAVQAVCAPPPPYHRPLINMPCPSPPSAPLSMGKKIVRFPDSRRQVRVSAKRAATHWMPAPKTRQSDGRARRAKGWEGCLKCLP